MSLVPGDAFATPVRQLCSQIISLPSSLPFGIVLLLLARDFLPILVPFSPCFLGPEHILLLPYVTLVKDLTTYLKQILFTIWAIFSAYLDDKLLSFHVM